MKTVAMVLFPDFLLLDMAGPMEVFSVANRFLQADLHYQLVTLGTEHGQKQGRLWAVGLQFTHGLTAPGERVDAFTAGEHVAEMRLITEAAFQADLRQAQVGVLDQQLGAGEALGADPVLR